VPALSEGGPPGSDRELMAYAPTRNLNVPTPQVPMTAGPAVPGSQRGIVRLR